MKVEYTPKPSSAYMPAISMLCRCPVDRCPGSWSTSSGAQRVKRGRYIYRTTNQSVFIFYSTYYLYSYNIYIEMDIDIYVYRYRFLIIYIYRYVYIRDHGYGGCCCLLPLLGIIVMIVVGDVRSAYHDVRTTGMPCSLVSLAKASRTWPAAG